MPTRHDPPHVPPCPVCAAHADDSQPSALRRFHAAVDAHRIDWMTRRAATLRRCADGSYLVRYRVGRAWAHARGADPRAALDAAMEPRAARFALTDAGRRAVHGAKPHAMDAAPRARRAARPLAATTASTTPEA